MVDARTFNPLPCRMRSTGNRPPMPAARRFRVRSTPMMSEPLQRRAQWRSIALAGTEPSCL
jgi:hypothetical protein